MSDKIQDSFDLTLKNSNLQNIVSDFAELSVDSILQEGVLKDIPIVSTLISLTKVGISINDKLFLKKILYFINNIKDVPVETRKEMIEEIDGSEKFRVKIGEKLLYIIESSNDHENSELVSKFFRAFLENKIKYDEFLKCSEIIKKILIGDLNWFLYEATEDMEPQQAAEMIGSGLFVVSYYEGQIIVDDAHHGNWKDRFAGTKYEARLEDGGTLVNFSETGKIIKKILFSQEGLEKYQKNNFVDKK